MNERITRARLTAGPLETDTSGRRPAAGVIVAPPLAAEQPCRAVAVHLHAPPTGRRRPGRDRDRRWLPLAPPPATITVGSANRLSLKRYRRGQTQLQQRSRRPVHPSKAIGQRAVADLSPRFALASGNRPFLPFRISRRRCPAGRPEPIGANMARTPCIPNRMSNSTAPPSALPSQCGRAVSNSAASRPATSRPVADHQPQAPSRT